MSLFLAASLLLAGCSRKTGTDEVMAKVNGRKILRVEVEKFYKSQTMGAPQQPSDEQAVSMRLSILRELIDNEILMQRAEKLGLLATDEEIESKFTEFKAPYTKEEFAQRLKERNLTEEDLKRDLRRTLTVQKVLNKEITSKITITDADIQQYYNDHRAEFNVIEPQYHLAHIVVSPQPNPQVRNRMNSKAQNDAEAKRKIQEILNRLESGEDFGSVAMNYSEDPETTGSGGDLGFVPESALKQTDPASREAVTKLKPGQFSGIVPVINPMTRQGFYRIVMLVGKEPAGQREVGDPRVQQAVRERLRERREQLLKAAYYETVRNESEIENYYAQEILNNAGKNAEPKKG